MKPADCLRILGLPATASRREIKRAYRRLALEYHPDTHHGDEESRRRFVELSNAYQTLTRAARGRELQREVGVCGGCGQLAEVFHSPDGKNLCERCILRPGGTRFLPLPMIIVVKCTVTILLNVVAVGCLTAGWLRGSASLTVVACVAGFLGLLALAVTCLSIRHCTQPAEMAMYRRFGARQAKGATPRR